LRITTRSSTRRPPPGVARGAGNSCGCPRSLTHRPRKTLPAESLIPAVFPEPLFQLPTFAPSPPQAQPQTPAGRGCGLHPTRHTRSATLRSAQNGSRRSAAPGGGGEELRDRACRESEGRRRQLLTSSRREPFESSARMGAAPENKEHAAVPRVKRARCWRRTARARGGIGGFFSFTEAGRSQRCEDGPSPARSRGWATARTPRCSLSRFQGAVGHACPEVTQLAASRRRQAGDPSTVRPKHGTSVPRDHVVRAGEPREQASSPKAVGHGGAATAIRPSRLRAASAPQQLMRRDSTTDLPHLLSDGLKRCILVADQQRGAQIAQPLSPLLGSASPARGFLRPRPGQGQVTALG